MVSIVVDNITVKLGGRTVLSHVSATFNPGQLIGIIGPNGAGKSSLVRAILGLVPVSTGTIFIDGAPLTALTPRDLARKLSYLPQGQTLHWPLSVERLVALGRLPHLGPFSRLADYDLAAIEDAMARANVLSLRHRDATELSGGERARVMLARALAVGSGGIVADEPLASLDPGHQIDVMELLVKEAQSGATVIAVLHDLTMAARYCDALVLIADGRLCASGPPANVLTPALLQQTYGIAAQIDLAGRNSSIIPLGRMPDE